MGRTDGATPAPQAVKPPLPAHSQQSRCEWGCREPGFLPGADQEYRGIIRHGSKLLYAYCEATVPKLCVVLRKAYGAGLYAMAGPAFAPDATLALPSESIQRLRVVGSTEDSVVRCS